MATKTLNIYAYGLHEYTFSYISYQLLPFENNTTLGIPPSCSCSNHQTPQSSTSTNFPLCGVSTTLAVTRHHLTNIYRVVGVIRFPAKGHCKATIHYTSRLAFGYAQAVRICPPATYMFITRRHNRTEIALSILPLGQRSRYVFLIDMLPLLD
jgi:hypothetical protein